MIVTSAKVFAPSGLIVVNKPVTSIDQLIKLITWRQANRRPLTPAGLPPQVWIVDAACAALGWGPDDVDPGDDADYTDEELRDGKLITDVITRLDDATRTLLGPFLAPEGEDGWHLYQPGPEIGYRVHLSRTDERRKFMVDLILEPWAWTATERLSHDRMSILGSEKAGTLIDFEDEMRTAQELGRRMTWHVDQLGVLPGNTPARTGAVILDQIYRDRSRQGRGIVVDEPLALPPIELPDVDELEPHIVWARGPIETEEVDNADELLTIDQRASYLASAGMIDLGYGALHHYVGDDAEHQAFTTDKLPFGVWAITLPAGESLSVPRQLPLPHPRMRWDRESDTWVSTQTLISLTQPIVDGGAGLDLADLGITEAWTTEHQGQVLKRWKEILANARKSAVEEDDLALKAMVSDIYKGYLGRIAGEKNWDKRMRHHYQPLWSAAIKAHARHRSRVKAMQIAREHDLWPIKGLTDAWTYLVPGGLDLSDELTYLGKFTEEKRTTINTDEAILALLSAASGSEIRKAIHQVHATAGLPDNDEADEDEEEAVA